MRCGGRMPPWAAPPKRWGGADGRTLFVTANRYGPEGASDGVVLTARVDVPRAGRP